MYEITSNHKLVWNSLKKTIFVNLKETTFEIH